MSSQSPIKLLTDDSLLLGRPTDLLSIDYPIGMSFPGDFEGDEAGHGKFVLTGPFPLIRFKGRTFKLVQVHIHHPSEHLVNSNQPSDFEIHFVHIPKSGTAADPKVVIGVLYRVEDIGTTPREFEDFVKRLPSQSDLESLVRSNSPNSYSITPTSFFPPLNGENGHDLVNWFHYEGSLTSYPYSEDVSWFVMRDKVIIPKSLNEELEQYAEQHSRPLQPIERRIVVRSFS